jgi:bifunctional DNase/RNase
MTDATPDEEPDGGDESILDELSIVEGEIELAEEGDGTEGVREPRLPPGLDAPAWFIPVGFVGVELTLPSTHPILVLEEIDAPHRQLRIPIGVNEGSAIAYAAQGIPTPRPLTHEFATHVFESFDIALETVRITDVVGNAYGGEAVFSSPMGLRTIRCRPSDGVCLALRQRLLPPIAVAADVLAEAGFSADERGL